MRHGDVRRRRDATRKDRESGVSAIEFVFLTPVLFFLIFATVQFAMYFFARHVAIAAAQEGARVARAEAANNPRGWQGDATDKASVWINQLSPNLLSGTVVRAVDNANGTPGWTVGVQVNANVPTLFPGMTLSVSESSIGPVEQFIPDK
jgi:Flp pilus assembly protein TadG